MSPNDGREPRWRADGRELYFLARAGGRFKVTAVPVEARAGGLHVGAPTGLFDIRTTLFVPPSNIFQYSPASNGQRFLVNVLVSDAEPTLNVITNWQAAARAAK